MTVNNVLTIKGIRDGLLVQVNPEADWKTMVKQLITRIDQQQEFFRGARLVLAVGTRSLRRYEVSSLQTMLSDREVTLWAVLSESMTTLSAARRLNLETTLEKPAQGQAETRPVPAAETLLQVDADEDDPPPIDPEELGTAGVLVKRTLRSGRTVRSDGHVVVIGDVNPGAEIIAGGDVIVWGRLRGMVHAGAHGDESAVVCALDMTPMQLRIAGHIAMSPEEKRRKPKAEIAAVRGGRIMVEAWH